MVVAGMLTGCLDSLETDKIDFSTVEIAPSLMLPLATANVTVGYLFDEQENAVEYYTDGDVEKIKLHAVHDTTSKYSIIEEMGFDRGGRTMTGSCSLGGVVDFGSGGEGGKVARNIDITMPINESRQNVIESMECDYEFAIAWTGFTRKTVVTVDVDGNKTSIDVEGNGSDRTGEKGVRIRLGSEGEIAVRLSVESEAGGQGDWGSISYSMKIDNVDNVKAKIGGLELGNQTYISLAYMSEFRRIMKKVEFKEPKMWLRTWNKTPLYCDMTPRVTTGVGGEGTSMGDFEYIVGPRKDDVQTYDYNNSNFDAVLSVSPDTLVYKSGTVMTSKGEVVISKGDSLIQGYEYLIPLEFRIDGDVDGDTIEISDVPEISNIKRAKIIVTCCNGLPLGGSLSVMMLDKDDKTELSSIMVKDVLPEPTIDERGVARDEKTKTVTVDLTEENISDLQRVGYVIVRFYMTSYGKFIVPTLGNKLQIDIALAAELSFTY